jgi:hypothetical protein
MLDQRAMALLTTGATVTIEHPTARPDRLQIIVTAVFQGQKSTRFLSVLVRSRLIVDLTVPATIVCDERPDCLQICSTPTD